MSKKAPEPQPARRSKLALIGSIALLGFGCSAETGATTEALRVECTDAPSTMAFDDWVCPGTVQLECANGFAEPEVLYADGTAFPAGTCADASLTIDDAGPYAYGTTEVEVSADGTPVCLATIEVVDTLPPEVFTRTPGELWPPNHRMVTVSAADCLTVTDACDTDVEVFFTGVESDEPMNDVGDGNHEPDMELIACDQVALRAERQGPEDGRVYTLHWQAVDDAGHSVEGTCEVPVPHDQSGRPAVKGATQAAIDGCAP
tara:strand:- start:101 stop:880 length:780 start_codon:yes stop_codon:yes gene_type:complete